MMFSKLSSAEVSVVKFQDLKNKKVNDFARKPSNWMESLKDDIIEVEDDILEESPEKPKILIVRPRYVFDNRIR